MTQPSTQTDKAPPKAEVPFYRRQDVWILPSETAGFVDGKSAVPTDGYERGTTGKLPVLLTGGASFPLTSYLLSVTCHLSLVTYRS